MLNTKMLYQMFEELLAQLGTERHQPLLKMCNDFEVFGCFALTELKHGSNAKEIKTTAHYDPKTEVKITH
jgi:acyl-CoA oxidase